MFTLRTVVFLLGILERAEGRGDIRSDTSVDTTLLHNTNSRLYMARNSSKSMPEMGIVCKLKPIYNLCQLK